MSLGGAAGHRDAARAEARFSWVARRGDVIWKIAVYPAPTWLGIWTFCTWLKDDQDFSQFLISIVTPAQSFLWKLAIALYFTSWLIGLPFDRTYQEQVYDKAPPELQIKWGHLVSAFAVLVLFVGMWVLQGIITGRYSGFAESTIRSLFEGRGFARAATLIMIILISLLWLINYRLWRIYVNQYILEFEKYTLLDNNNPWSRAKIRLMHDYMNGSWQWMRFNVGVGLLAVLNLIFFSATLGNWPDMDMAAKSMVLAICLLAFVVIIEGWIWLMRLRLVAKFSCLRELLDWNYELAQPANLAPAGEELT